MRECGLKFTNFDTTIDQDLSLPLRECGLKLSTCQMRRKRFCHSPCGSVDWNNRYGWTGWIYHVTPLAGVWIEMQKMVRLLLTYHRHSPCGSVDWNFILFEKVVFSFCHSPCGSVDWNCCCLFRKVVCSWSLPLRECGLKCRCNYPLHQTILSLPLRECGLKYGSKWGAFWPAWSLPLRECGLKCRSSDMHMKGYLSLPLRECGLKFQFPVSFLLPYRHSPCGSVDWNQRTIADRANKNCHSPCGSVDWNQRIRCKCFRTLRHSPCGSVDWNWIADADTQRFWGHSPCGSVDWNCESIFIFAITKLVTPLAGVWIEITGISSFVACYLVTPLAGVWIEIDGNVWTLWRTTSLPLRECGLKLHLHSCRHVSSRHSPCGSVDWNSRLTIQARIQVVTPLAGVWIEMLASANLMCS